MRFGLELGQNKVIAPMILNFCPNPAAIVRGGLNGKLVVVSNRVPLLPALGNHARI
jgi:hypothetical protein